MLRIAIDSTSGGALGPIFEDGSFEYIPIPEGFDSKETRTYRKTIGRCGEPLSTFLPRFIADSAIHYDPEFETCTYGDPTTKRGRLLRLEQGDLLLFYAGLSPYKNNKFEKALYIIGFFVVEKVLDFNKIPCDDWEAYYNLYSNNAHIKREEDPVDLVIVIGNKNQSKLLDKAIRISQKRLNKEGRAYHAVSDEMEKLLGISGSIQRSSTPRVIEDENYIKNIKQLLALY